MVIPTPSDTLSLSDQEYLPCGGAILLKNSINFFNSFCRKNSYLFIVWAHQNRHTDLYCI